VASQGVSFIKDLTEEEAVFVFPTSPDIFGHRPDNGSQKKSLWINSLIESDGEYALVFHITLSQTISKKLGRNKRVSLLL